MRRFLGLVLDVLNGLPSIVIGIFVYGLLVVGSRAERVQGCVALSIMMLPLVARSTQEVLALVPESLREASQALGVSRWRTVLGLILPTSFGGILTGATLAVARAAGETAPLLFTCSLTTSQVSWDPRAAAVDAADDLPVPRSPLTRRSRAGLGSRTRADDLRARDQRPVEGGAGTQPEEALG